MKYTIMGYTVANADQARSVMMMALLKGNKVVVKQCMAVIAKYMNRQMCQKEWKMETNESAALAYTGKAMEIIGMVNALQQYADGLHDVNPDDVNWGNVGDLERVASMLRAVLQVAK